MLHFFKCNLCTIMNNNQAINIYFSLAIFIEAQNKTD